jgi:hypothetical protein
MEKFEVEKAEASRAFMPSLHNLGIPTQSRQPARQERSTRILHVDLLTTLPQILGRLTLRKAIRST